MNRDYNKGEISFWIRNDLFQILRNIFILLQKYVFTVKYWFWLKSL